MGGNAGQYVLVAKHYPMMTSFYGNIFRVTGYLCGEFTGHQLAMLLACRFAIPEICVFNTKPYLISNNQDTCNYRSKQTAVKLRYGIYAFIFDNELWVLGCVMRL